MNGYHSILEDLGKYFEENVIRVGAYVRDNYSRYHDCVYAVQKLYEEDILKEELVLRRDEAFQLYLSLVAMVRLRPDFAQLRAMQFRALLLVMITRTALERECPVLIEHWWRIGTGNNVNDTRLKLGNLWSRNFFHPQLLIVREDESELCPHRDHIIKLNPPYEGFGDLQRSELANGRVMMILPLSCREKSGQKKWRGFFGRRHVQDGIAHRIVRGHPFLKIYSNNDENEQKVHPIEAKDNEDEKKEQH